MEIKIVKQTDVVTNQVSYLVQAKTSSRKDVSLLVSETSEQWNTNGIINFLLSLIDDSNNPITIDYDKSLSETDKQFGLLVELFDGFSKEFNQKLVSNQ